MAAVFPESMERLEGDAEKNFSILDAYIRYMSERMEFSMKNMVRNVNEAGVSTAEIFLKILDMGNEVSMLQSGASQMTGEINGIKGRLGEMDGDLSALQPRMGTVETAVNRLSNDLAALTARVEALEAKEGEA